MNNDRSLELSALNMIHFGEKVLCKQLETDDFTDGLLKDLFTWFKNEDFDPSAVQEKYENKYNGVPYCWLTEIIDSQYVGAPYQIVKRLKILRARREAKNFKSKAQDEGIPQEFHDKSKEIQSMLSSRMDSVDDIVERIKSGVPKIPTRFKRMDYLCKGGIEEGGIMTIAAMEGTGKTAMAINIAKNVVSDGSDVCFITLEMSKDGILTRFMQCFWEQTEDKVREHIDDMKNLPARFHVVDAGYDINTIISTMMQFLDCKLFIIDYFDLITSSERENRTTQLEINSHKIKEFAFDNKKSVVVLAQISKELQKSTSNREPILADLHGTSALSKDSHTVSFVWDKNAKAVESDSVGSSFKEKKETNKDLRWIVKKNRNGLLGSIMIDFKPEIMTFTESEDAFRV